MHNGLDILHQAGPILVTVGYVSLYYAFQIYNMQVKARLNREYAARGEKFDRYFGQDRRMLAADRLQLNMLEHMPPFLALMWLVAMFVGPGWATWGGVAYLAARAIYPLAMGSELGRGVRARIIFATGPGYLVLIYFVVVLAVRLVLALAHAPASP